MVVNDPMLFETMIAFSKVSLRYYVAPSQRLTADIRSHIAKVLTQLGSRLATHDAQSPEALMLTVYYLFVLYQAAGDFEGCAIHFRGLQQLRGNKSNVARCSTNDVVCTSIASAELYSRYMASERCPLNHNTTNTISDIARPLTYKPSTTSGVPPSFIGLTTSGVLSSRGVRFLSNLELFLGQPYMSNAKNRMIVILALEMIEAMRQSDRRICASKT
ncbi:hypothetical protein LTR64_004662 [Lithohypha guttulata]|uniref:uncharacterized protein n=1 Tax=Lithohypha guttulata TaxID=1690604 RepID=UPI002DDEC920|nr:hypothetical protein LTR51_006041 [Lithohypha guttulata]